MSYIGLSGAKDEENPHVGGNIKEGDPWTFAPSVWNYLIDRFAIQSVLDLGSGLGYSSNYFYKKGLSVIAVDGMVENVEKAIYPTILQDITKNRVHCRVDLVHCQELVEHIEEQYLDNLLQSLTCGKFIVMTNALPEQRGYHHVNEQLTHYWANHLKDYNCDVLQFDTLKVRQLAQNDGAEYLRDTGLVLVNRNRQ